MYLLCSLAELIHVNRVSFLFLLNMQNNRLGSGDPEPSEQDILLTRELCMCSKVVSIEVLDHVIIGSSDYASMKLRELM